MAKKQKTTLDILKDIQSFRNEQIKESKSTNIFVTEVQLIGTGENSGKKIYRLLEDVYTEDKNGNEIVEVNELFYQYDEKPKLIGKKIQETGEIVVFGNGSFDELSAQRDEIDKCLKEREEQFRAIAKEIGFSKEEIESLSEIELEHKIAEMGINREKDEDEQQNEEEQNRDEKEDREEDARQISKRQVYSIGSMNEISLDAPIDTKGNTLGKELGLKEYAKIMVVHSYKLDDLTDSQGNKGKREKIKFGFIAQKRDGTFETIPLDKISMYRGENRDVTTISDDEEDKKVETRNDEYIFNTPKSNKKLVIRQSEPYGIPEVYLAQTTRDNDGMVGQEMQDRYDGTKSTNVEVREKFNPNKGRNQIDNMRDEAEGHEEVKDREECEEEEIKDIDGDRDTANHLHLKSIINFEGMEAQFDKLATTIGGCVGQEEIQDLLDRTNMKLHDNDTSVTKALKTAINERNNEIIEQAPEPEKVRELMERANVKNPKKAIQTLEMTNWKVGEAVDLCDRQYRNKDNEDI